jgi:hypothetical protein
MKLSRLLDRLRAEEELHVEERTNSDGIQQFIVWTQLPFPKNHSEWYVFTLPPGIPADDFDVESWQIDAMLRHLWMLQLEIHEEASTAEVLDPQTGDD